MIRVVKAPPYLSIQDGGRRGYRSLGVPVAGAMDQRALSNANALVGNPPDAAVLEWALGGGTITFDSACAIGVAGASVDAAIGGKPLREPVTTVSPGDELEIRGITSGRFVYVAVSGGLNVPLVLGSRSTYLPAGWGGFDGRLLRTGDVIQLGEIASSVAATSGGKPVARPAYDSPTLRAVPYPFTESLHAQFFGRIYTVSAASDRTGYRLEGERIEAGALPPTLSVGVCPGTIQLPPSGLPIVLLADAPTVGGYPILGVVCSADLPIVAQKQPGATIAFTAVTVDEAQRLAREEPL